MKGIHCGKCERAKQKGLIKGCKIYERNKIVVENLGLVGSMVNKFRHCPIPKLDRIQLAHEGLVIAAERFNPDKGVQFKTYATWWIRQRITRNISKYKNIPCTVTLNNINIPIKRFISKFKNINGRYPTADEIVENVSAKGWSKNQIRTASIYNRYYAVEAEKADVYTDNNPGNLYDLKESVLPDILKEKEKIVIQSRNIEGCTLNETAEKLYENGYYTIVPAIETVRYIEKCALKKIARRNNA